MSAPSPRRVEIAGARITVTGAGAFSVMMQERTQREATLIGTVDSVAMILLLVIAYGSARSVALGVLPLASGGLAGLAAVTAYFGVVHGITLAFGFTLIGVAQDYPIHLLSHQHRGITPLDNARAIWPTLATGVAGTCIAYLAFLFSGVNGLAQLAVFAIAGLAVAGLTTRILLPRLMPSRRTGLRRVGNDRTHVQSRGPSATTALASRGRGDRVPGGDSAGTLANVAKRPGSPHARATVDPAAGCRAARRARCT